jgi:hypothetical protein
MIDSDAESVSKSGKYNPVSTVFPLSLWHRRNDALAEPDWGMES